jgi:hypothetical protein
VRECLHGPSSLQLSLRHLPQFFRFMDLVMERFDKSIDHQTSRSMTMAEGMAKVPDQQKAKWAEAFQAFSSVWNQTWHRVERFGCACCRFSFPLFFPFLRANCVVLGVILDSIWAGLACLSNQRGLEWFLSTSFLCLIRCFVAQGAPLRVKSSSAL